MNETTLIQPQVPPEHPASIADHLRTLEPAEMAGRLENLSPELRAEVFAHLESGEQELVLSGLSRAKTAELLTHMAHDERAAVFRNLPEDLQEDLYRLLARAEREDILRLASYPEGTAGSVMTSEYATLSPNLTAQQALEKLRREAPEKETIYNSYVVDPNRRLLGVVELRDLILARPDTSVSTLMKREVISAKVDDDQEELARKMAKYDLLAIPVTNGGDALVGIVTHDDVIDILQRENTEDAERFMGIVSTAQDPGYLQVSSWRHFRKRVGWVVGLAAVGLVSGTIIHSYEDALTSMLVLALYMPMVADTGGNTGSQSATVVIRALALQQISTRDGLKVLFKEFKIALLLSLILGVLAFGKVLYLSRATDIPFGHSLMGVAAVIAGALTLQVITATLIGAGLPLIAAKFKGDPAVISSPALTTIVDITGLLIYFTLATSLLRL